MYLDARHRPLLGSSHQTCLSLGLELSVLAMAFIIAAVLTNPDELRL